MIKTVNTGVNDARLQPETDETCFNTCVPPIERGSRPS